MKLEIQDHISEPGKLAGHSEDRYGWNDHSVFVIDGATGIGERQVMTDFPSDAAWLADHAARQFRKAEANSTIETVRAINAGARARFFAEAGTADLPRYAWPTAAFQMLAIENGLIVTYGLGDCRLFLQDETSGEMFDTTAIKGGRDMEIAAARAHLQRIGGFRGAADIAGDAETIAALRAGRSQHNMPGGRVFTLGLVPEAADQVARETTGMSGPVRGLICTDGFAALTDSYAACSPAALVQGAFDDGLRPLLENLRRIERVEDPDGMKFPRYKVSDDAAAVAFRITP